MCSGTPLCLIHRNPGVMRCCPVNLAASSVWYVGDRIETDIAGAKQSGLTSVWYNRRGAVDPAIAPDLEVSDWSQFLALLQK